MDGGKQPMALFDLRPLRANTAESLLEKPKMNLM
jgi:hypothetical protein